LIRFGFQELQLHRLIARCEIDNHASERVMAKLGMEREGILREHLFARGRWWTSAQWSILNNGQSRESGNPGQATDAGNPGFPPPRK